MTKPARWRVARRIAWALLLLLAVIAIYNMIGFPFYYVKTTCDSRILWSDSRLILVVCVSETHVRLTPLKWLRLVVQWNVAAAGTVDGRHRQHLIVCEAHDGRVEATVCDDRVSDLYLTPYRGEVYAEEFAGMNKPRIPWRWTGSGFERANDDITALLQAQRIEGVKPTEHDWQTDEQFTISGFRDSRPPLTGLGKNLGAAATITKWCKEGDWNSPLRVRFEVSLPNGASQVIDLDLARRSSNAATYDALPANR